MKSFFGLCFFLIGFGEIRFAVVLYSGGSDRRVRFWKRRLGGL